MNQLKLLKMLVCPKCKRKVQLNNLQGKCKRCKILLLNKKGIWHCLYIPNKESEIARKQYESMYNQHFGYIADGSYEILASLARGNKTVDIACGEGFIEKLSPETVGVEFSLNALKKAKAHGAKYLVLADAHALPFTNDSFDIALSLGNLEHFADPQKAIMEMARISKIQVLTVHREFSLPFAYQIRIILTKLMGITHQPIEKPITLTRLEKMIIQARLNIVFKGFWTLPVNFGNITKYIPVLTNIPSCFFIIAIKKR